MSGPNGVFVLAPAFLAAYFLVALIAPTVCKALSRNGLIVLALLPGATTVWALAQLPAVLDGGSRSTSMQWVPSLSLSIDLRLDALSMIMTLVVAGIGTLVLLYSGRYFPDRDEGLGRYSGALIAFAGAMLGLVWADNLILLVIFWELTGILSYLLIAHRTGKRSSRMAASQALMVTTAGGLVLLIGVVMLGVTAGTFTISEIIANPPSGPLITTAVVLMIVGGISKSAIIPFQFWLPGAMAAPTPASAYLHAATMVKAGIYLFARLAPAFAVLPLWQPLLMTLGGATMLYGGVIALRQRDLKLLLAYGTVSQLGLMTLLIGCGNPDALLGGHGHADRPCDVQGAAVLRRRNHRHVHRDKGSHQALRSRQEHAGGGRDGHPGGDQHGRDPADARLRGQGGRATRVCWTAAPPGASAPW